MKTLKELLRVLSSDEISKVRQKLKQQSKKKAVLFNLLLAQPHLSDETIAETLYDSGPNSAYSHLKKRLEKTILEVIFSKSHITHNLSYFPQRAECWYQILLGHFFLSRESYTLAQIPLSKARELAVNSRLHPELLIIQDLLAQFFTKIPDKRFSSEVSFQVKENYVNHEAILKAKKTYARLHKLALNHNINWDHLPQDLKAAAEGARQSLDKSLNPKLRYWNLRVNCISSQIAKNPQAGIRFALEVLSTVRKYPDFFSQAESLEGELEYPKMGLIANCPFKLTERVIPILNNAPANSWANLEALECVFLYSCYRGDLHRASVYLNMAKANKKVEEFPFFRDLWLFYEANLEFLQGNFSRSLALLYRANELLKYKSKWLIGCKLLEIYNFISQGNLDLVEYKLGAYKQLLKRQKDKEISRAKYIGSVLHILVKNGYDFQSCFSDFRQGNGLFSIQRSVFWEPLNFEVVFLEQFLELSAKKKIVA